MLTKTIIQKIEEASLPDGLAIIAGLFPGKVAFSSSLGHEDQVIADVIYRNSIQVSVFTIDTGRLFNETYDLLDRTMARYRQAMPVYFPASGDVEEFVASKGINGFYDSVENRKQCCHIRKVLPLNRALAGVKVWVTGLRATQSANREQMNMIEWDESRQLYKYNPLISWSYDEVMNYIEAQKVPSNILHKKGFYSIGCAPCTRAIEPGEDARAGRWWWESSQKECGLHQTIIKQNI
jgi:phosphoadenosine phosphosulfate reductase